MVRSNDDTETFKEREGLGKEGNYRLASKAFTSLPTIREIMGLVMGILVMARNSSTRFQMAFLRHVSCFATLTAAAKGIS